MKRVMNAPINTFFDVTPVGKILVRFSSDLEAFEGGLMWSAVWLGCCLARGTIIVLILARSSIFNIFAVLIVVYLYY